jgi:hypothetical protein
MDIFRSIKQYLKTDTLGLMIIAHGQINVTPIETKTCPMNLKRSILSPPGHITKTNIHSLHEMKNNIIKSLHFDKFKEITEKETHPYIKEVEKYHSIYEDEDENDNDPRTYSLKDMRKINKKMLDMPYTVGHYTDEISEFTENPTYINKVFSTEDCTSKQNHGLGIYTLNNYRNYWHSIPANTNILSESFLQPILKKLGIVKSFRNCLNENREPIRLITEITYNEIFSILEYLGIKHIYIFDISCEGFFANGEECEDARTCRLIKRQIKKMGVRGGTRRIRKKKNRQSKTNNKKKK